MYSGRFIYLFHIENMFPYAILPYMSICRNIFSIIASVFICLGVARADMPSYGMVINSDFTVSADDVYTGEITVRDSLILENNGSISGTFTVADGCQVTIRNRGSLSLDVVLGAGATITQIITEDADITNINLGDADYNILVNGRGLSLNRILAVSGNAGRVILRDAVLSMDMVRSHALSPGATIELQGHTIIEIEDRNMLRDVLGSPLFRDVAGTGTLSVRVADDDPLYVYESYIDDDSLSVRRVRWTDYSDILGNTTGEFLDWLRDVMPNDGLLHALDNAQTMAEINSILARSGRVNPINLMRPVRMLNSFEMNQTDNMRTGMFAAPVFIMADDFDMYGVNAGIAGRILDTVDIRLTAYASVFDYADDINDFGGNVYGANIAANYDFDIAFIRGVFGASYAEFDVGPVFDGTDVVIDPHGRAIYALADIGHKFTIDKDKYISPFVGVGFDRASILNQSDTSTTARIGADAGYGFEMAGIRYDYGARVYVNNNGIGGALRMSAWSEFDDAGVDAMIGTDGDDIGRAYKFSITGKWRF